MIVTFLGSTVKEYRNIFLHKLAPDFISPYKHYPAKVIEEAVEEVVEKQVTPEYVDGEQDISTTKRWVKTFKLLYSEILGTLESIAFRLYNRTSSLMKEIGGCFSRLKTVLKLMPDILSCCLFGKINTWLTVENTNLWLLGKKST
jgi:hypothetical protein